jgi:hypothetical protein
MASDNSTGGLIWRLEGLYRASRGLPPPPPPPPPPVVIAPVEDNGTVWTLDKILQGERAYDIPHDNKVDTAVRIARIQECEAKFRAEAAEHEAFKQELWAAVEAWEREDGFVPPANWSRAQRLARALFDKGPPDDGDVEEGTS